MKPPLLTLKNPLVSAVLSSHGVSLPLSLHGSLQMLSPQALRPWLNNPPWSSIELAKLGLDAGIHVFHKRPLSVSEFATGLLVRKTGSAGFNIAVKVLIELAAWTTNKVSMDLTGNAPSVVDAALVCKFRGSGQTCYGWFPYELRIDTSSNGQQTNGFVNKVC